MPRLKIQKRGNKLSKKIILIICFFASLAFVIFCGYLWGAWTGFPKGHDAYAHMTRIKYILDFFPNVDWQYHWANGMPLFKSYAPLHSYLGALLVGGFNISIAKSVIVLGFVSYLFLVIGIFGIVYTITKKAWLAFLANVLTFSPFATWDWMVFGGNYPRVFALGLMFLTLFFFIKLIWKKKEGLPSKHWYLLSIFSLFLTMISHVLIAFFTCATIFFIVLFLKLKASLRFRTGLIVIFSSLALASFFYLPLILSIGSTGATFIGVEAHAVPMQIKYIFSDPTGLGLLLLPLLFFLLIVNLFVRYKTKDDSHFIFYRRLFWPFFTMLFLFLAYALVGHTGLKPKYYYINGFIPLSTNIFITIYSGIIISFFIGRIADKKKVFSKIFAGFIALVIFGYSGFLVWRANDAFDNFKLSRYIPDYSSPYIENVGPSPAYISQQFLKFPSEEDYQHRFAAYDPFDAVWFNVKHRIPQERDYYGQGILYPDWRYWFEQVVWKPDLFTMEEAKAAFDWFAIRWFADRDSAEKETMAKVLEYPGQEAIDIILGASDHRYLKDTDFSLVNAQVNEALGEEIFLEIEINNPSNILEASNAPTLLYIGEDEGYYPLFFNLTLHNFNSQDVIIVKGKKNIDDYKLSELQNFDVVFLYSYRYKNKESAYSLTKDYVENGGNLIWEAWNSEDVIDLNKEEGREKRINLPEPSPVNQLVLEVIENQWDFQYSEEEIFKEVNLAKFSPPVYVGTPWKVAVPPSEMAINDWAEVVLTAQDHPIMISGQYGEGQILWTGFNFNYHVTDTKNFEEAKLLINIIEGLINKDTSQVSYKAEFINPNKREIKINDQARGVLFRESYFPNWQAENENGKKLEVWYAGPGLMYVPLDKDSSSGTIYLKYQKSTIEKIGLVFSLLSIIVFIIYVLEGKLFKPFIGNLGRRIYKPFTRNIKDWWSKEDEEE